MEERGPAWAGEGMSVYWASAGARSCAVRWTLRLLRSSSKKGLVTGEKGQTGRVGVGIRYIPLPAHSEMMDLTYLGAHSYQKRCLK